MKVPLEWISEFVEVTLDPLELARVLTFAGLEVEGIRYVGRPLPPESARRQANVTGMAWDRQRFVVGYATAIEAHPDADRLAVVRIDDGETTITSVSGAPNLVARIGEGALETPLPLAVAREGAEVRDYRDPDGPLKKLEAAAIRGVESNAMVCSERELGISDDHSGVIVLDDDAPPAGTPLADALGDVVFDIAITPNMARNASIYGVAREIAALTGAALEPLDLEVEADGPPVEDRVAIDIRHPELNPRFTATLLEGVTVAPSPYWLRRRLQLAGVRPIANVVDATNYVMLELGQPLHAFDYDALVERAGGDAPPTIVTRLPEPGERLTTLDGVERELDEFTILVADRAGALSLGGVMGGRESEVRVDEDGDKTTRVLLEAAAWNFINIRRTTQSQQLSSEAGYRFSRGVHPAMAPIGNRRGIELMRRLAGGTLCSGMVDEYPAPPPEVVVDLPDGEVERLLGIRIPRDEVARILTALEFEVEDRGDLLRVTSPGHRLDIGTGAVGRADVLEEIARVYGYEKIPETQISDTIPPQHTDPGSEAEERVRDILVELGLREVVSYRLTSPEREARLDAGRPQEAAAPAYVRLAKAVSEERAVMRRSVLASVLEAVEANARFEKRMRLFEIGPVFLPQEGESLPAEPRRLCIALTGRRDPASWSDPATGDGGEPATVDFYDLKGTVDGLLDALHVTDASYKPANHPTFHTGRSATLEVRDAETGEKREIGVLGELHPEVSAAFGLTDDPVLAADLDLEALLGARPQKIVVEAVPRFPPVRESLAIIVDEGVSAAEVERALMTAGRPELVALELFDFYQGEQLGSGKKSLGYHLVFQSEEGTLTDEVATAVRERILGHLRRELGAQLRGG